MDVNLVNLLLPVSSRAWATDFILSKAATRSAESSGRRLSQPVCLRGNFEGFLSQNDLPNPFPFKETTTVEAPRSRKKKSLFDLDVEDEDPVSTKGDSNCVGSVTFPHVVTTWQNSNMKMGTCRHCMAPVCRLHLACEAPQWSVDSADPHLSDRLLWLSQKNFATTTENLAELMPSCKSILSNKPLLW